jgi:hypothetical protein
LTSFAKESYRERGLTLCGQEGDEEDGINKGLNSRLGLFNNLQKVLKKLFIKRNHQRVVLQEDHRLVSHIGCILQSPTPEPSQVELTLIHPTPVCHQQRLLKVAERLLISVQQPHKLDHLTSDIAIFKLCLHDLKQFGEQLARDVVLESDLLVCGVEDQLENVVYEEFLCGVGV